MKTRPLTTVQPHGNYTQITDHCTGAKHLVQTGGMIRLRGKWVLEVFPVKAQLIVTREERGKKIVLVLEEFKPLPSPEHQEVPSNT